MENCRLTVFTPVYNRAHCIGRCYESMLRQKNSNFIWIIVDDGADVFHVNAHSPGAGGAEN